MQLEKQQKEAQERRKKEKLVRCSMLRLLTLQGSLSQPEKGAAACVCFVTYGTLCSELHKTRGTQRC